MTQLKTFRGGSGWNSSSWPAETGAADTTSWAYQESTGLLTAKTFADGKSVGYTYSNDGKLATRAWARLNSGSPLLTTYAYDASTAEMTSIDYADSTPDVSFTYDRLGRTKTVTDAVGSRTFAYSNTLQLASETITGLYSKTVARNYDTIGRKAGFNIGTEYNVSADYDTYGRINSRTAFGNAFSYSYLANSDLVSSISSGDVNMNWTYEANRNLVTAVQNKYGTDTVSGYAYTYDALGRRNEVVHSGSAFTQSNFNKWLYNDKSELLSAKKYLGTDPADLSNPITNYDHGFNYDNIGNRLTSTSSGATTSYTSNNLNQYSAVNAETPTYDDDGNMLTSSVWTYEWDAENRLKKAESGTTILEFKYDYMSRRIEKKLTQNGIITKHERFVYDDYKCIEKLDILSGGLPSQKYAWRGEELLCMSGVCKFFCVNGHSS